MPIASKLCGMLARACTFPVGIPAYKVDPEVKKTFDFAQDGDSQDYASTAGTIDHRANDLRGNRMKSGRAAILRPVLFYIRMQRIRHLKELTEHEESRFCTYSLRINHMLTLKIT